MNALINVSGHKLIVTPKPDGRVSWTCECGDWHPMPARNAPFPNPTSRETVIDFIQREHNKHAMANAKGDSA